MNICSKTFCYPIYIRRILLILFGLSPFIISLLFSFKTYYTDYEKRIKASYGEALSSHTLGIPVVTDDDGERIESDMPILFWIVTIVFICIAIRIEMYYLEKTKENRATQITSVFR